MARQVESILLIKKDIEKLLKDYKDGRINLGQLIDGGEELDSQLIVKNYRFLEKRIYQRGTLEFIYSNLLNTLEDAASHFFFPEDVPVALEYLNTKESDDVLAAIEKWEEYWRNIDTSERGREGMRRGYWNYREG